MENNSTLNLTLLKKEQVRFGRKQLKIFKKYGKSCSVTDFAILLGCDVYDDFYVSERIILRERAGWWWTSSSYFKEDVLVGGQDGTMRVASVNRRCGGVRPAVSYSAIKDFSTNKVIGECDLLEIEFGEYPQMVVEKKIGGKVRRKICSRRIKKDR